MSDGLDHINYSAADIERYHKGEMSALEMHAMEMASLEDPMLADAMEGYEQSILTGENNNRLQDLATLREQIAARTQRKPTRMVTFPWWKVAAVLLLVLSGSFFYLVVRTHRASESLVATRKVNPASDHRGPSQGAADSLPPNDVAIQTSPPPASSPSTATSNQPGISSNSNAGTEDGAAVNNGANEAEKKLAAGKDVSAVFSHPRRAANKAITTAPDSSAADALALQQRKDEDAGRESKAASPESDVAGKSSAQRSAGYSVSAPGAANNNIFSAKVVDESNHPVTHATVQIPTLNITTITDQEGHFSFKSQDSALKVSIASTGFETENLQLITNSIDDARNIIRLRPSLLPLSDAAGGGAQKKLSLQTPKKVIINLMDAEPVIGWTAFNQYLNSNKSLPAADKDVHGDVVVSFTVSATEGLKNIHIQQSLSNSADATALRLIKTGPAWHVISGKKATVSVVVSF